MSGYRTKRSGFSLVELVMALAIIGILASVAALNLRSSVAHSRLQKAVSRLSSDLILVRDQAMRDQQDRSIVFNHEQRTYQAVGVRSLRGRSDIDVSLASPEYSVSALAVDAVGNTITFDFGGRCAADATITLESGPQQRSILVTTGGQVIAQEEGIAVVPDPNI